MRHRWAREGSSPEWSAEVALHRAGSKKLIKHFRPPQLGINNHPDYRSNLCCGAAEGALKPIRNLPVYAEEGTIVFSKQSGGTTALFFRFYDWQPNVF